MQSGHVLTFPGTRAGFARAFAEFRRALDDRGLHQKARYNCELVFEEVVTNIIKHGYSDDREHDIEVSIDFPDSAIVMRFEDDGEPFDPLKHTPTRHTGSIVDAKVGGRGLALLRAVASRLDYTRTPNQRNCLVVTVGTTS
jgi:serine/threonine-protein kinase RsbW